MTKKSAQKVPKKISLRKSVPKVPKVWGVGGQTFLEEFHNKAAFFYGKLQGESKANLILNFISTNFVNYKISEPPRFQTSQHLKKIHIFFNRKVCRGSIYYHIVDVPIRGAWLLSFFYDTFSTKFHSIKEGVKNKKSLIMIIPRRTPPPFFLRTVITLKLFFCDVF